MSSGAAATPSSAMVAPVCLTRGCARSRRAPPSTHVAVVVAIIMLPSPSSSAVVAPSWWGGALLLCFSGRCDPPLGPRARATPTPPPSGARCSRSQMHSPPLPSLRFELAPPSRRALKLLLAVCLRGRARRRRAPPPRPSPRFGLPPQRFLAGSSAPLPGGSSGAAREEDNLLSRSSPPRFCLCLLRNLSACRLRGCARRRAPPSRRRASGGS